MADTSTSTLDLRAFFGVLRKPFSLRAMADVVAAAVEQGRISSS